MVVMAKIGNVVRRVAMVQRLMGLNGMKRFLTIDSLAINVSETTQTI